MMTKNEFRDRRIIPIKRLIQLTIIDYTTTNFSVTDQEEIAEKIEDVLRERYDVEVELIEIETIKAE